jgi:hypothetical protein
MLPCAEEKGNTCMEDEILRYAQNDKGHLYPLVFYCLQIGPILMFLSLRRRLRYFPARGFSHRASVWGDPPGWRERRRHYLISPKSPT